MRRASKKYFCLLIIPGLSFVRWCYKWFFLSVFPQRETSVPCLNLFTELLLLTVFDRRRQFCLVWWISSSFSPPSGQICPHLIELYLALSIDLKKNKLFIITIPICFFITYDAGSLIAIMLHDSDLLVHKSIFQKDSNDYTVLWTSVAPKNCVRHGKKCNTFRNK